MAFIRSVEVVMGDGVLVEKGRVIVIATARTTSNLVLSSKKNNTED